MSLPILSSRFFKKHRPDLGFFTKWESLFTWSESILPIYEWQGVLYVGCLQPPDSFPETSEKVVFVLCEPTALQELWYEFQGTVIGEKKPEIPPAMQAFIEEPQSEAAPVEATLEISAEAPADLLSEFEGSIESEGDSNSESESSIEAEAETEPETEESEFLDLNLGEPSSGNAAPSISLQPLGSSPLRPVEPPAAEEPEVAPETVSSETATLSLDTNSGMPSSAKENTRAKPSTSEVLLSSQEQKISAKAPITALSSETASKMDPSLIQLFAEMNKKFQKSMILLKSGDQIKPWKWDQNFEKDPAAAASYSLIQPSPFRIVLRTQKPYHGFIVANDLNSQFLKDWNGAQMPEHLTIAPVIVEDHVVAMVLGIGTKASENKAALKTAEDAAVTFSSQIKEHPTTVKVA